MVEPAIPPVGTRALVGLRIAARAAALAAASARDGFERSRGAPDKLPAFPADIDAEWIGDALAGTWPGIEVASVRCVDATEGTTSRARLGLTYRSTTDPRLPATVFAKVSPRLAHRVLLNGLGMVESEVRFYRDLADEVPVRAPRCYHVAFDAPTARFVLVLEDLASDGARFGIATEPLGFDEAGAVLDALARLHGRFWTGARLDTDLSWLQSSADGPFADFYRVVPMNLGKGLRRAAGTAPTSVADPARLAAAYRRVRSTNAGAPHTVLHGDPHLGNLYFTTAGDPGFLDWQLVQRGSWAHDVGYFLVSALDVADRRRWERELLVRYLEVLAAFGGDAPAFDDAWARYRAQPAYGLCMWLGTLSLGDYQSDKVSLANVERFAAAAIDLGTLEMTLHD